jgi:hypothetical protein
MSTRGVEYKSPLLQRMNFVPRFAQRVRIARGSYTGCVAEVQLVNSARQTVIIALDRRHGTIGLFNVPWWHLESID